MKSTKNSVTSVESNKIKGFKDSTSPDDNPKPLVRACDACRSRKARCLTLENSTCQRCAKAGRECIFTYPDKRQRRKRTDTRVAELEHTVQVLATKLEYEQRARLEQSEHLRRYSDNQRAIFFDSTLRRGSDVVEPSLSGQDGLHHPTNLKIRELSLAGPLSPYTSSSPSDFSASEGYDALSKSDAVPSPNSTLASTETFSPTFVSYQSPSMSNQQVANWPTSNSFHGLPPQQANRNGQFYSSNYSCSQGPSLALSLPPQTQSCSTSGVAPYNPAFGNVFASTPTGAYSSNTLNVTSVPTEMQSTWGSEPSNDHPFYAQNAQSSLHGSYMRPQ
ncbi:MAG: hypothetical protein Q9216_003153 [Gyalolechia sp. 2 TL-2023]